MVRCGNSVLAFVGMVLRPMLFRSRCLIYCRIFCVTTMMVSPLLLPLLTSSTAVSASSGVVVSAFGVIVVHFCVELCSPLPQGIFRLLGSFLLL